MVVRGRTLQGRGVTASRRGDGRESAGGGVGWKEREEREAREKWKGRTVARVVGAKRERVGSSHADRNGPTEFYPTIREARRGSGPRPTAATARNARPASVFPPSLGKLVSLSKGRDQQWSDPRGKVVRVLSRVHHVGGRDPSRFRRVPRRRAAGEFSVFP